MFKYFIRNIPDENAYINFYTQILLITLLMLFSFLSYKFRKNEIAIKSGIYLSLFQQITLYSWYIYSKYNLFKEGLPLYHCRIAMIGLIICYLFNFKKAQIYFALLGFVGSIIAFSVPSIDPFIFPHITNFSFVLGHFFLMFNSVHILFNNFKINNNYIFSTTLLIHFIILAFNILLKANYGFLLKLPASIPLNLNVVSTFILITLAICFSLSIINTIRNKIRADI